MSPTSNQLTIFLLIVEFIMKRNSQIASLFKKHEAKKMVVEVDDVHIEDNGLLLACIDSAPPIQSDSEIESETEYCFQLNSALSIPDCGVVSRSS